MFFLLWQVLRKFQKLFAKSCWKCLLFIMAIFYETILQPRVSPFYCWLCFKIRKQLRIQIPDFKKLIFAQYCQCWNGENVICLLWQVLSLLELWCNSKLSLWSVFDRNMILQPVEHLANWEPWGNNHYFSHFVLTVKEENKMNLMSCSNSLSVWKRAFWDHLERQL